MTLELGPFLRARWHNVRYGFVFIPGAIVAGFIALSFLVTWLDRALGGADGLAGFTGDASTARSILSTIATALITVAGLTFSLTVVSLQLVSQQFSPRTLRNFLGDRINQIVAGSFVGIFAYCLLVLRTIRGRDSPTRFVPSLSVTVATALAILTLGLLLLFIHHMSTSIQLSTIAAGIANSALAAAEALAEGADEHDEHGDPDELVRRWRQEGEPARVHAGRPGFVQTVAVEQVRRQVDEGELRLNVLVAPGDFVTERSLLAEFWTDGTPTDEQHIRALIPIANEREVTRDVGYGLRQLADIAIRALSPGVNDPTTASTCVGYMQAVLEQLAAGSMPSRVRRFCDGAVTAVVCRSDLEDYLETLHEVAHHASDDPRVSAACDDALARIRAVRDPTSAAERSGCTDGETANRPDRAREPARPRPSRR